MNNSLFGFANPDDEEESDGKPKRLPHKHSDTLKAISWADIYIGMKVQSVLTRTMGAIICRDEEFHRNMIGIDWENGNKSRDKHCNFDNVVKIVYGI